MKEFIRKFPSIYNSMVQIKRQLLSPKPFKSSKKYWINRYNRGGNSGVGSYNRLAEFKGDVLNNLVIKYNINSVLEMGSGDGNQLAYFDFPNYIGLDISSHAITICRKKFKHDHSKQFILLNKNTAIPKADLVLSLDVLYHLVEDEVFYTYMKRLFSSSKKFVIIYSCNFDDNDGFPPHVRPRKFTNWVDRNIIDFQLIEKIENKYPYDSKDKENTSFADFYIYRKLNMD